MVHTQRCIQFLQESAILELVVDETITETLETDNLVLQNMSSSKYVQVCVSANLIYLTSLHYCRHHCMVTHDTQYKILKKEPYDTAWYWLYSDVSGIQILP